MNNMELETDIEALDMEMGDVTIHYCPVIPNPEGEPTAELKTADIEGTIYEIADEEARTELENKVDKEEGKGLSENDYTDEDKAIVGGVTTALDGKVDKDGDKVLSDNNYSDEDKAIVVNTPTALDGKADKSNTYTKTETDNLLSAKANTSDLSTVATSGSYNDLSDTPNLSTVATSGDYDDLTNKPVIDTAISPTSTNAVQNKVIYDLLSDLFPEATETGNPISITNASGLNAKSLKVELEPIQDTSGGEPSPEHICPISGRTQTVVKRCGKNLFKGKNLSQTVRAIAFACTESGNVTANGTNNSSVNNAYFNIYTNTAGDRLLFKAGTYTFSSSVDIPSSLTITFQFRNSEGISIATSFALTSSRQNYSVTINEDFELAVYLTVLANQSVSYNGNLQIEVGSSATTYEPYTEADTTIQFGQTVYGGTCDVVNGGTSETWKKLDLGSIVWTPPSASGISYSSAITDFKQVTTGQIHFGNAVFDNYKFVQSILNNNTDNGKASLYYHTGYSGYRLFVCDTNLIGLSAPQVATYMQGKYICYELETPTTLASPEASISLLKGNNTLTADGDMELVYSKTPQ